MKKLLVLAVLVLSIFADNNSRIMNKPLMINSSSPSSGISVQKPNPIPMRNLGRDLLFDQSATAQGTFYSCQWDSVYPAWSKVADNFSIPYNSYVDSLVWWGGYYHPGGSQLILDFWIEIYPDSGNGGGVTTRPTSEPIYCERVAFTEVNLEPDYNIHYAKIPAFLARGGYNYWIVFQPTLINPPQWGNNGARYPNWGDGQTFYFKSDFYGYPAWTSAIEIWGDTLESSFQLYGTVAETTPPTIPELISPSNQATVPDTSVIFTWHASQDSLSGVMSYTLEYCSDSIFTSPDTVGLADTSFTTSLSAGIYYWRVKAADSVWNESNWSEVWSFTAVETQPPTIPELISPPDDAQLADSSVTFVWHASSDLVSGVDHYTMQYNVDSLFVSSDSVVLADTSCTLELTSETYYWRVKAADSVGNESAWSEVWSFTTLENEPPTIPELISPPDDAQLTDSSVTFVWHASSDLVPGVDHYTMQYNIDSLFVSSDSVVLADTSCTLELTSETYYWRVKAADSVGNESAWSEVWSFTVLSGIAENNVLPAFVDFAVQMNPTKGQAVFNLALPQSGLVNLRIYDALGRLIDTPFTGIKSAGIYQIPWTSNTGGAYFYHLEAPGYEASGKLVIIK